MVGRLRTRYHCLEMGMSHLINWRLMATICFALSGCDDRALTNQVGRRDTFFGHIESAWKYVKEDMGLAENATISDLRKALADLNEGEAADFETLAPDELLLATVAGIQRGDGMKLLKLSERRMGESRLPLLDYSEVIQREFVRDPDRNGFPSFYLNEPEGMVTLTSDLQVILN